jgi:hypothetical protein
MFTASRRRVSAHRPDQPPRPRPALGVEVLEDRTAPSVLTVTTPADSGDGSLRAQVAAAANGDTINFDPGVRGTIRLTSGELLLDKNLIIQGPGATLLAVSGNNASRVFEVAAGVGVTWSGLSVTGGRTADRGGGALVNGGAALGLSDLNFNGNVVSVSSTAASLSAAGGGLWNAGALTLTNVALSGNSVSVTSTSSIQNAIAVGSGGGVYNAGTLAVNGGSVSGNSVMATAPQFSSGPDGGGRAYGGGIANDGGTLTVAGSAISLNSLLVPNTSQARSLGGGIYNDSSANPAAGAVTVSNSTLSGNHASASHDTAATCAGGGIYMLEGTLTVTGSTFSGNYAAGVTIKGDAASRGGGIWAHASLPVSLAASTFSGNYASVRSDNSPTPPSRVTSAEGGGLWADFGTLQLTNSTLARNDVSNTGGDVGFTYAYGGGLYHAGVGSTVTNVTVAGNYTVAVDKYGQPSDDQYGGGIYALGQGAVTLALTNCTVADNRSVVGGGIDFDGIIDPVNGTGFRVLNTLVADNAAALVGPDVYGTADSLGTNLIGKADDSDGWLPSDLTGTAANPLAARLGPLAHNGGPTQTIALLAGSPAIAAGTSAGAPAADQRGVARGSPPCIGAYEFVGTSPAAGDGLVDLTLILWARERGSRS